MKAEDLNEFVVPMLGELVGEQYRKLDVPDDDAIAYSIWFRGTIVTVQIRAAGKESVIVGQYPIGAAIRDEDAARAWMHERNQALVLGRVEMAGDAVFYSCHLIPPVDKDSLRTLLMLLANERNSYPNLAEATGALTIADAASLEGGFTTD